MAKNIARDGSPKKLDPLTVNGGMYYMRNGQLIAGVSKTKAAQGDGAPVTAPKVSKRLGPVATTPGMRSRTVPNDARLAPRRK